MRFYGVFALAAALFAAFSGPARAMSEVTVLPGWLMDGEVRMAGIRITLAPGWKTYWRAPQGNGIPPQFDWSGSKNLASVRLHFPKPEIFESYGSWSIGYSREVVFPVELVPADPDAPISIALSMFYGVCEDVCIPAEADLAEVFPAEAQGGAAAIRAALSTGPQTGAAVGIASHDCRIRPAADGFDLTATLRYSAAPATPQMVVIESGAEDVWITTRAVSTDGSRLIVEATLDHYGEGAFLFDRSGVRMTLLGTGRAIELRGCPAG